VAKLSDRCATLIAALLTILGAFVAISQSGAM
jgi:hypothetical protein